MKDGTITAFSSKLTLGQFLRHFSIPNIFRYIIHVSTKSTIEHVGILCNDDNYEALVSPGVVKEKLLIKLRHLSSYTKVSYYELNKELTQEQRFALFEDLESQLGKQYALGQALISAIDNLLPRFMRKKRAKKLKTKKQFCSKLAAYAYKNLGLIDVVPRNLSPQELIDLLLEKKLVTKFK